MALKQTITNIKTLAKDLVEFGLILALIFLVIDILFGAPINIVGNLVNIINIFVENGVVGLIALLVLLAIYNK